MKKMSVLTLVVFLAPSLLAAGWNKPYFAATKPGTWASYRTTSTVGPPSILTLTRLADHDGQIVIEGLSEFNDKVTPSSTNRYELAKGFDADHELIDYLKAVVAMSYRVKGGESTAMPAAALAGMKAMPTYAATAVFKATETIDGKACDHYTYTRGQTSDPTIETGDIWLNADVPFGEVKHTTTTKDQSGKVKYTTETVLTGSGTKTLPAATTAKLDPTTLPMTIKAAYDAGLIDIKVEIAPEDKRGDHLKLTIMSQGKPLTITIAAATTSLHVDIPFDNLVFTSPAAQKLEITPAKPATIVVNQVGKPGEQRVVAGKFTISTYEGKPMFQGSATSGFPK
jgi:hypothetical protein